MELVDGQDFNQEDSQEDQESFYKPWIEQDFAVWGKDGIKQVRPAESFLKYAGLCIHRCTMERLDL